MKINDIFNKIKENGIDLYHLDYNNQEDVDIILSVIDEIYSNIAEILTEILDARKSVSCYTKKLIWEKEKQKEKRLESGQDILFELKDIIDSTKLINTFLIGLINNCVKFEYRKYKEKYNFMVLFNERISEEYRKIVQNIETKDEEYKIRTITLELIDKTIADIKEVINSNKEYTTMMRANYLHTAITEYINELNRIINILNGLDVNTPFNTKKEIITNFYLDKNDVNYLGLEEGFVKYIDEENRYKITKKNIQLKILYSKKIECIKVRNELEQFLFDSDKLIKINRISEDIIKIRIRSDQQIDKKIRKTFKQKGNIIKVEDEGLLEITYNLNKNQIINTRFLIKTRNTNISCNCKIEKDEVDNILSYIPIPNEIDEEKVFLIEEYTWPSIKFSKQNVEIITKDQTLSYIFIKNGKDYIEDLKRTKDSIKTAKIVREVTNETLDFISDIKDSDLFSKNEDIISPVLSLNESSIEKLINLDPKEALTILFNTDNFTSIEFKKILDNINDPEKYKGIIKKYHGIQKENVRKIYKEKIESI